MKNTLRVYSITSTSKSELKKESIITAQAEQEEYFNYVTIEEVEADCLNRKEAECNYDPVPDKKEYESGPSRVFGNLGPSNKSGLIPSRL